MRKQKQKIVRSVNWLCQACKDSPDMNHAEMIEHLKTVHGFVPLGAKCRKSLIQAIDGSDFYSNVFEWTIPTPTGEVKAIQTDTGPRHAGDLLRFEE